MAISKIRALAEVVKLTSNGSTSVKKPSVTASSNNFLLFGSLGGKAQDINDIVYTPKGYTKIRDLKIGDSIFNEVGEIHTVLGFPYEGTPECYRVSFNDNTFLDVASEHLWTVEDIQYKRRKDGSIITKSTIELLEMGLLYGSKGDRRKFRIPLVKPIDFNEQKINIDPYLLGLLLGDGGLTQKCINITNCEEDIVESIKRITGNDMCSITWVEEKHSNIIRFRKALGLEDSLNEYGLFGKTSHTKFIPNEYKYNTSNIRLKVLQGLIDTDGSIENDGHKIVYYSMSKQLADDVCWIVRSLGGMSRQRIKNAKLNGKSYGDCHVVTISFDNGIIPFSSIKHSKRKVKRSKDVQKTIESIEKIDNIEMKCISTSSKNGLYITNDFIVTHNSLIALSQLTNEAILVLTPASGSNHLAEEFPNACIYPINNLDELIGIAKDLEQNFSIIRNLENIYTDTGKLDSYFKKVFKPLYAETEKNCTTKESKDNFEKELNEEFAQCIEYAKNGKFPFYSVVLEECDIVSAWLADVVEKTFKIEILGEDKSNLSSDWSEYRKYVVDFYTRFLKLPVVTILATSDRVPKEKQGQGSQTTANLCMGAGQRLLISMIGNVLYVSSENGKYFVQLVSTPEVQIRTKFLPMTHNLTIPTKLDVTGSPEKFWELIKQCDGIRKENAKKKMDLITSKEVKKDPIATKPSLPITKK